MLPSLGLDLGQIELYFFTGAKLSHHLGNWDCFLSLFLPLSRCQKRKILIVAEVSLGVEVVLVVGLDVDELFEMSFALLDESHQLLVVFTQEETTVAADASLLRLHPLFQIELFLGLLDVLLNFAEPTTVGANSCDQVGHLEETGRLAMVVEEFLFESSFFG